MRPRIACSLIALFSLALAAPTQAACDRECLRGTITTFLHALVKDDTSRLPLASNVRITEDSVEKPIDKLGLIQTVTKIGGYRQDFIDERAGVVAANLVVEESGAPILLVVRMKVANDRITELETVATRSRADGAIFNLDGLQTTTEVMNYVPRPEQLVSRVEAIRIALLYPAGLEVGSFVEVDVPFTDIAYRLENGAMMAGPDCKRNEGCKNIKTQPLGTGVRGKVDTRVILVDERMGIVLLRMAWGRPGGEQKLAVWEAFKIYDGKIHAVEAFMKLLPKDLGSGWDAPQGS